MSIIQYIDEKIIVALAFFVCIGIFLKFGGSKILELLRKNRSKIISEIVTQESIVETKSSELINQTRILEELGSKTQKQILEVQNNNQIILRGAEIDLQKDLEKAEEMQSKFQKRKNDELNMQLKQLSWQAAKSILIERLKDKNYATEEFHSNYIDKTLDLINKT